VADSRRTDVRTGDLRCGRRSPEPTGFNSLGVDVTREQRENTVALPAGAERARRRGGRIETDDPALQGEMKMTISLSDADGGTELVGVSSSRR
jgi:hypothetical protein